MKKVGFGLIGLVLIAAVYYFTNGSAQVIRQAKQQLNNELSTLQQSGFSVKERKSEKKKDHFIVSFDNPEQIVQYLNAQGAQMRIEDARALKGFQIGVDATYLQNSYSAVSLDLYPVALPESMKKALGEEDKKLLNHLKSMLAKKALLLHIDFDKTLSGFKGYTKDINETIEEDGEKATIAAKGMTFEGETKEDHVSQFSQKIELLSLDAGKALQVKISDIDGGYIRTGTTPYDVTSRYRTGSISVHTEPQLSLQIKNIENETKNSVSRGLLKSIVSTKAETVEIDQAQKKYTIKKSRFDFTAENLDADALEALQKTDPEDEARINQLTQQLLSKGVVLKLDEFSANKITENGKNLNGFDMNGTLSIAKSFDMNALFQNPLLALESIDIRTHISVSDELYAHIVQDPRAMIMMMMVPPVSKKGKNVYDIVFVKGKITVNGVSF